MSAVSEDLVRAVLRFYAELSPSTSDTVDLVASTRADTIMLGVGTPATAADGSTWWFGHRGSPTEVRTLPARRPAMGVPSSKAAERLARLGALHVEDGLLRHGWVTIAGTITVDGVDRQVLQPLLSEPVRLRDRPLALRLATVVGDTSSMRFTMTATGDAEITPMVEDVDRRSSLAHSAQFGRGSLHVQRLNEALLGRMSHLASWIRGTAAAADLPGSRSLPPSEDPFDWVQRRGLVAVVTRSLYMTGRAATPSIRSALLNWSGRPGVGATALASLLTTEATLAVSLENGELNAEPIDSVVALSDSQRHVVRSARSAPVTVVSGPPGSGKTHTVCAIAFDAIAQGRSVLVATQSRHAADVVTEQLRRVPGPDPVRFGDGAGMAMLIDELSDRQQHPIAAEELCRLDRTLDATQLEASTLRESIAEELRTERDAASAVVAPEVLLVLTQQVPAAFAPDADLAGLDDALDRAVAARRRAQTRGDGWWSLWRARRAARSLRLLTRSDESVDLGRIDLAIRAGRSRGASTRLELAGGTNFDDRWERLRDAEQRRRTSAGERLRALPFSSGSLNAAGRAAIGSLITALRAGRGRRRQMLAELEPGQLTSAAPLWIGTLSEIEDVLPATAGIFDLVVLDEASQIEQSRAAPALLRARRAVIVGDPRQLRHISFRSDEEIDLGLARNSLSERRTILDTRRVSTFDLAAMVAPVDQLREHFRSVPHLIEFSIRTFYRDRIGIMTRHPHNESVDAIDFVEADRPSGGHSGGRSELDVVLQLVHELGASGERSVGVITPFREQADLIEERIIGELTSEQISQMSLRTGTVHSFQGGERDVVIISVGLDADAPAGRRRFVEQPNLFNVMITRARRRVIVVTSIGTTGTGTVAEYLRYAEHGLPAVSMSPRPDPSSTWHERLATELERLGETVRRDYPVGAWQLEIVAGEGNDCRFLETAVVDSGPEAHIDRHLALMELGWRIVDAYPSRWDGDAVRAAIELYDGD